MGRLVLHSTLLEYVKNVYFQPPSSVTLNYPCIIYHKSGKDRKYGNNKLYLGTQRYDVTVIDRDPDSTIADELESSLQHCIITGNFRIDNLNHTSLTLYYDINNIRRND